MFNCSKGAFSLVEVILVVLILDITLTPVSILIMNVFIQNPSPQGLAVPVGLAEGQMERITSLRFSSISSDSLHVFSAPFLAYGYQVTADYVNPTALNTAVVGPTDYKRVRLDIIKNASSQNVLSLISLVTNDW